MNCTRLIKRFITSSKSTTPKICIVGAGPAGFYAAQHLTKNLNYAAVDFYEKLPVPFGLVRFGVAPDHPEVKNVINTFTKTAEHPNVRYFGNVTLGQDISMQDLKKAYHIVLLTYGAEQSQSLNIPGEKLRNALTARDIVGWYNGVPWNTDLKIDLNSSRVTIFGQGNVAIDVARILLSDIDKLKSTDITEHALDALAHSKVREVCLIGRRGPLQAAFTIKELREMLKLGSCKTCWNTSDFRGIQELIPKLARPKKRITELMINALTENCSKENKLFKPMFFRAPLEIFGTTTVEKVKLGITKLQGDDFLTQKALLTGQTEILDSNMTVTSIGYKAIQVDPDIAFDVARGVVKNTHGKVENGVYVTGWLGTGPTGVILTTMNNAFAVAESIINDLQQGNAVTEKKQGHSLITSILKKNNVQIVTWKNWQKIDKYEQEEGKKIGKPRKKILDVKKMLEIAS